MANGDELNRKYGREEWRRIEEELGDSKKKQGKRNGGSKRK